MPANLLLICPPPDATVQVNSGPYGRMITITQPTGRPIVLYLTGYATATTPGTRGGDVEISIRPEDPALAEVRHAG